MSPLFQSGQEAVSNSPPLPKDKKGEQPRQQAILVVELKCPYEDAANMKFEATRKLRVVTKKKAPKTVMELGHIYKKDFHVQSVPVIEILNETCTIIGIW
ncbi:hypothetical protein HAX54_025625 [Datura stramonium]|uniref:Uncharacterized protein n=1 Tax=Datura stramonium TaxID=4076 RepID=A0ABS8V0F1_DATST|nr:hypothetical protein [Datura stramonium]